MTDNPTCFPTNNPQNPHKRGLIQTHLCHSVTNKRYMTPLKIYNAVPQVKRLLISLLRLGFVSNFIAPSAGSLSEHGICHNIRYSTGHDADPSCCICYPWRHHYKTYLMILKLPLLTSTLKTYRAAYLIRFSIFLLILMLYSITTSSHILYSSSADHLTNTKTLKATHTTFIFTSFGFSFNCCF